MIGLTRIFMPMNRIFGLRPYIHKLSHNKNKTIESYTTIKKQNLMTQNVSHEFDSKLNKNNYEMCDKKKASNININPFCESMDPSVYVLLDVSSPVFDKSTPRSVYNDSDRHRLRIIQKCIQSINDLMEHYDKENIVKKSSIVLFGENTSKITNYNEPSESAMLISNEWIESLIDFPQLPEELSYRKLVDSTLIDAKIKALDQGLKDVMVHGSLNLTTFIMYMNSMTCDHKILDQINQYAKKNNMNLIIIYLTDNNHCDTDNKHDDKNVIVVNQTEIPLQKIISKK